MSTPHPTVSLFIRIWAILMLLLVVTVYMARYDLGDLSIAVALAIATAKGALIVLYFMHVRYNGKEVYLFAGAAYLWLLILIVGTLQDYLSRHWIKPPPIGHRLEIKQGGESHE